MLIAYFLIGLFITTYALGKDREVFREPLDDGFVILANAVVWILIWPVIALICVDIAVEAEKTKREAKKGK